MNENISLLEAIVSTMDTIPIVGIDAMDKFVGCANAIRNVSRSLQEMQAQQTAETEAPVEEPIPEEKEE